MSGVGKNWPKRIYEDLKKKIQTGEIVVGERLPPEKDLASSYGVAVLTLRKALAILKREGWIVSRRYHGTHAADPAQSKDSLKVVGLIIPNGLQTLSHPVFSRLVDGVEGIVSEQGYELRIGVSAPENPTREKALRAMVQDPAVKGWLIPSIISARTRAALRKAPSAKVLLHFPDENLSGHCFEIDYFDLALSLLSHLAPQGYRHIVHIGPPSAQNVHRALSAAAESGIAGKQMKVRSLVTSDYTPHSGRIAALNALGEGTVDIFICADDLLAMGALQALEEGGRKAPDIGVIGAGDFPFGLMTQPPLSTISFPYFPVGRQATQLLIDIVEGRNVEPAHRRFFPRFVARGSSLRTSSPTSTKNTRAHYE